jgi:tRNA (Thr-GGU) A37 N-methylase
MGAGCVAGPCRGRRNRHHVVSPRRRDVFRVHRSDLRNPLTGVFATRSPDRPNPLGLHPVVVRAIDGKRLRIGPIEAIDGTPVVDIKPVLK